MSEDLIKNIDFTMWKLLIVVSFVALVLFYIINKVGHYWANKDTQRIIEQFNKEYGDKHESLNGIKDMGYSEDKPSSNEK